MGRSFSAVLIILVLATGNGAACAGWMATPEARMACCSDEGSCPMHTSDSHGSSRSRPISQAEADSCCAASEKEDAASSPSTFVLNVSLAVVPGPVQLVMPVPAAPPDGWRSLASRAGTHVARHLLLSVLLV